MTMTIIKNYSELSKLKTFKERFEYLQLSGEVGKSTFGFDDWNWEETFDIAYDSSLLDIEIIGICTDICVITNALLIKTYYPEAKITVDASCCAGSTPEKHKAALDVMESCQINVINRN